MATLQLAMRRFSYIEGPAFNLNLPERDPVLRVSRVQVLNPCPDIVCCAYCGLNQHATSLVNCNHSNCYKYFCNGKSTRTNRYSCYIILSFDLFPYSLFFLICVLSHILHHLRENPDHRDLLYYRREGNVDAFAGLRCCIDGCSEHDIFQLLYFPMPSGKDILLMCSYHVFEKLKNDDARKEWRYSAFFPMN
jgi:hypothetical protein